MSHTRFSDEYHLKRRVYMRKWTKEHPRVGQYNAQEARMVREQLVELFGGVCSECGIADPRVLDLDHRDGGGHKHRKQCSSQGLYRRLLRGQESMSKYRLLCRNCNWLAWLERKSQIRGEVYEPASLISHLGSFEDKDWSSPCP